MRWRIAASVFAAALIAGPAMSSAATLADWTFETSQPVTAGPFNPEIGAGSASGFHSGASTYSAPAGNGSSHSFSSSNWSVGDYYQFSITTASFQNIGIQWDQTSSNTGPKDFALDYSTDGTNFTQLTTYSVLANAAPNNFWSAGTNHPEFTFGPDAGPASLNNQAAVYFRLVDTDTTSANGLTVASGGTDRVDNVIVSGSAIPEPATAAITLIGAFGLLTARRRNRFC